VRLQLYDGVTHLRDQLLSGVLDLAILPTGRVLVETGIGSVTLVREPVYLAGPPGEFALGSTCALADVVRLPLVGAGSASL
jgi:LysR family nitrogen assimilation transcriptional regulator